MASSSDSSSSSSIEITGDTTELVVESIVNALKDQSDCRQIRLFNINLARLGDDHGHVEKLERLLTSPCQKWERVVICLCQGHLSDKATQGILNTKRLEIYGNTLNLLETYADQHHQSHHQNEIEVMKLRTRFNRTSIIPLTKIMTTQTALHTLHLTCEFLDVESMEWMAEIGLRQNTNLKHLTMYSCEFVDEGSTSRLIQALVNHPTLETLAWQDNNHLGMSAITDLVSNTQGPLKELTLYRPPLEVNDVQVPQLNIQSLSIALQNNQSLKSLDLSSNGLNDESAVCLALALRFNSTLESLNLQGNAIQDRGVIAIGEALPEMKGLKSLFLWNNKFRGVGARALLAGLKENLVLEAITTFSGFHVAKALQFYTHLNKAGGQKLRRHGSNLTIPLNLWPLILSRVNSQEEWQNSLKSSVLYMLVRERPATLFGS